MQSLLHTYQRFRTLQTHKITALPVVILMPHSACNCRCIMCDIWKDNKNLKQLNEADIKGLLDSLKKLGTQQILMSGGEALLNSHFFRLCEIFQKQNIDIVLLSTGLLLEKNASLLVKSVKEIIVSLDGDEKNHDRIRNIPQAFKKLKEGVSSIKSLKPDYKITARTVIQNLNYKVWPFIIDSAHEMGLDQISFLPADISSQAFNREIPWDASRQTEIMISEEELPELKKVIEDIIEKHKKDFDRHFIAESPEKIRKIHSYYSALHGLNPFPYKKCNAPWVSTVIEADGTVRPCFFHSPLGNIRNSSLNDILNSDDASKFRRELDLVSNEICVKCVCYLNLKPTVNL